MAPCIRNLCARWRCLVSFTSQTQYTWLKAPGIRRIGWVICRTFLDTAKFLEFELRSSDPKVAASVTEASQLVVRVFWSIGSVFKMAVQ